MEYKTRYVLSLFLSSHSLIGNVKVLTMVLDNAANNDTLVRELKRILAQFQGPKTHVHCFAHILNLVVKVCAYIYVYKIYLMTFTRQSSLNSVIRLPLTPSLTH